MANEKWIPPSRKEIQHRIEKIMSKKKYSQAQMAEVLGVTDRAIRHWLKCERDISKQTLMLLDRAENELKIA